MSHFYAMLFRMRNIERWSLMRNMFSENLAEHSLEVAFIAHALAVISNRRFGANYNAEKVAVAAMFHDAPEIITGDLPTPVKYCNPQIKAAYRQIEREAQDNLLALLPEDLCGEFTDIFEPDPALQPLIHAADKIQALIKCNDEISLGNREFAEAKKATEATIREIDLPAVRVFLEEFLPSFSLPLDSQTKG
ncbi:MAG: 5'-deoxynucleotidase [Clostridia bacterium]|nr:5'-deoxynucleotidase [Clostridia bacterium]